MEISNCVAEVAVSTATAHCYFIFFAIFLGNRPDDLFLLDFNSPPFVILGLRLSVASQPLFVLQAGVKKAMNNSRNKGAMR